MGQCTVYVGVINSAQTGQPDTAFAYFSEAWFHNMSEKDEISFEQSLRGAIKRFSYDGKNIVIGDESPTAEADIDSFSPDTKEIFENGLKQTFRVLVVYCLYSASLEAFLSEKESQVLMTLIGVWNIKEDNWAVPIEIIHTDPVKENDMRIISDFIKRAKNLNF